MFPFSQSLLCDNGAKARVDEQLIIFYSLQRKDRIKEQFCYKRRDLIKRSQITFKNTTSRIFFQIPFILCCDYIRQQVRIDCSELNTDSKLGLTFLRSCLVRSARKYNRRWQWRHQTAIAGIELTAM